MSSFQRWVRRAGFGWVAVWLLSHVALAASSVPLGEITAIEAVDFAGQDFPVTREGFEAFRRAPLRPVAAIYADPAAGRGAQWYRLTIVRSPNATEAGPARLRLQAAQLRRVEAFLVEAGECRARAVAGYAAGPDPFAVHGIELGLPLQAWRQTTVEVYLRIVAGHPSKLDPEIVSEDGFMKALSWSHITFSLYVGALAFLLLIQASFVLNLRDRASRDYIFFAVAILLAGLARSGYWDIMVGRWLHGFYLAEWRSQILLACCWLGLRSLASYLDLHTHSRRLVWTLRIFNGSLAVVAALTPVLSVSRLWQIVSVFQLLAVTLAILTCGFGVLRRLPGAGMLATGWSGILVGTVVLSLGKLGLITLHRNVPEAIPVAATLWEMIFISIGLGHRLRLIDELRRKAELQEIETAGLSRLVRVITHDISTPVAVISYTAELMERAVRRSEAFDLRTATDRISRSVASLLEIIQNVRNLARLRSEQGDLRLVAVDIVAALRQTAEMFEERLAAKGITLVTHGLEAPVHVLAEPTILRTTVLANAYSNALKFSPPGGKIGVAVGVRGDRVEVAVTDHGPGIDEARCRSLLGSAPWVPSTNGTAGETGTGFGVALMRDFTRAMRGDFMIAARPAAAGATGTVVTLRFRRAASA